MAGLPPIHICEEDSMNYRIGYIGFGGMAGGYHYDTAMR